ncbi:helix-turn-helix domain-containing protein [Sphingomonas sp. 28-62-11]|uniref:AraC family transcriptional regulator n=1 Tax=Sphingomonas sp. 28-62-11 TaxID=1970432 RepID=UPI0035A91579
MEPWQILDLLLRGMAVGAQLGLAIALARSAEDRGLRIVILLLFISSISLTLTGVPQILRMMGSAQILLWLIQIGGAGYFWLFAVMLFEDRRLTWISTSPSIALTVIGLFGQYGPRALAPATWGLHNVLGLLLALNALFVIIRSGQNDLVEARRRLRVPFLLLIAVFSVVISAVQIGQGLGINSPWYQFANASLQALLGIGGVAVLLEARSTLFGVSPGGRSATVDARPIDDSQIWLDRLQKVMDIEALWRREGLTIGDLATAVGLPEHRLRRLINDQLGHRNFASFVNQRRIAEARTLLSDPASAARTVASIAFDLGFGSLGPFNRAFRDETGLTPTEYRRQTMANSSPIPENPR